MSVGQLVKQRGLNLPNAETHPENRECVNNRLHLETFVKSDGVCSAVWCISVSPGDKSLLPVEFHSRKAFGEQWTSDSGVKLRQLLPSPLRFLGSVSRGCKQWCPTSILFPLDASPVPPPSSSSSRSQDSCSVLLLSTHSSVRPGRSGCKSAPRCIKPASRRLCSISVQLRSLGLAFIRRGCSPDMLLSASHHNLFTNLWI